MTTVLDTDAGGLPRRKFLTGLTAPGAGALLSGCQTAGTGTAGAGTAGGKPHRIDVHHHFASPGYSAALKLQMRGHAKWSVEASLEEMDKSGIATSITSLLNPGIPVWSGDAPMARKVAREANARSERICGQARARPSGPLWHIRVAPVSGQRGEPRSTRSRAPWIPRAPWRV